MNDNDRALATIIGRVWREKGEDSASTSRRCTDDHRGPHHVRRRARAMPRRSSQIGEMEGAPDDEPHLSAWQGALEGEIAIVTFNEEF